MMFFPGRYTISVVNSEIKDRYLCCRAEIGVDDWRMEVVKDLWSGKHSELPALEEVPEVLDGKVHSQQLSVERRVVQLSKIELLGGKG